MTSNRNLYINHTLVLYATITTTTTAAAFATELCNLSEIYALFDLLRCSSVFVVSYGVLVGVISRRVLIQNIKKLQV